MSKLLAAILFLLLAPVLEATTTITGQVVDLGTNPVVSNSFVRFTLRGCGGNQATVPGVGVLAPTQGAIWFKDFPVNASGAVSGTIYSTRDATGLLGGDIFCGQSFIAVWYGMTIWLNGKPGPEIPVHALNGATLNVSTVLPIQSPPVVPAPTGDTIYCRLDALNGLCPGTGGGGSGVFQANGTNLLNPAVVNFINSAAFNGLTFSFSNPALGSVQLGASGTLNNSGLTNSSLTVNLAAPGTGGGSVSLGGTLNLAMPACVAAGASHAAGLVPDPGASINLSTFLRSDCTFQVPAGAGNVSNSGTPAIHQVGVWVSSTTVEGIPVGINNQVLHGLTGSDPVFGAILLADLPLIPLTSQVSGLLPIANNCPGSTGASGTTFLRGDCTWAVPAGSNTGTVTHSLSSLTLNQLVLGNALADVKILGTLGTTTTVLHGNAAGAPSFGAVNLGTDVSSTLPVANNCPGSTGASNTTYLRGDCTWSTPAGSGTTVTIASGTAALGTSAIASGACASTVAVTATGTATTDNFIADFNADPTSTVGYAVSTSGMLTIIKWPTTNNVNFKVCNNTLSSITPGAITLNWRVLR
jgi:hypothetical protein